MMTYVRRNDASARRYEFGLQVTDQDEVCMPGICVWKVYRAWHPFRDTMNNRTSVLTRAEAVCYNSWLTRWADKNIVVYRERTGLTLPNKVTIENVKCPKIYILGRKACILGHFGMKAA